MACFYIFAGQTLSILHTEYRVPVLRDILLLKRFRRPLEPLVMGSILAQDQKQLLQILRLGDHESGMSTERERVYGKQKKLRLGKIA
jgi:hypothetical protein